MLDMKIDKIRNKSPDFDERKVKKAEIAKINEFCKTALVMFAHYTWMYAPHSTSNSTSATKGVSYWQDLPLHALVDAVCSEPDESE